MYRRDAFMFRVFDPVRNRFWRCRTWLRRYDLDPFERKFDRTLRKYLDDWYGNHNEASLDASRRGEEYTAAPSPQEVLHRIVRDARR